MEQPKLEEFLSEFGKKVPIEHKYILNSLIQDSKLDENAKVLSCHTEIALRNLCLWEAFQDTSRTLGIEWTHWIEPEN